MTKERETAKRTNLAIVDQAMLVETEVSAAKDAGRRKRDRRLERTDSNQGFISRIFA